MTSIYLRTGFGTFLTFETASNRVTGNRPWAKDLEAVRLLFSFYGGVERWSFQTNNGLFVSCSSLGIVGFSDTQSENELFKVHRHLSGAVSLVTNRNWTLAVGEDGVLIGVQGADSSKLQQFVVNCVIPFDLDDTTDISIKTLDDRYLGTCELPKIKLNPVRLEACGACEFERFQLKRLTKRSFCIRSWSGSYLAPSNESDHCDIKADQRLEFPFEIVTDESMTVSFKSGERYLTWNENGDILMKTCLRDAKTKFVIVPAVFSVPAKFTFTPSPPPRRPGSLIVSYHWNQQYHAVKIQETLLNHNFRVYMDFDFASGIIAESIQRAILDSDYVLVLLSNEFEKSSFCQTEVELAVQYRKKIIRVCTQDGFRCTNPIIYGAIQGLFEYKIEKYHEFDTVMRDLIMKELLK